MVGNDEFGIKEYIELIKEYPQGKEFFSLSDDLMVNKDKLNRLLKKYNIRYKPGNNYKAGNKGGERAGIYYKSELENVLNAIWNEVSEYLEDKDDKVNTSAEYIELIRTSDDVAKIYFNDCKERQGFKILTELLNKNNIKYEKMKKKINGKATCFGNVYYKSEIPKIIDAIKSEYGIQEASELIGFDEYVSLINKDKYGAFLFGKKVSRATNRTRINLFLRENNFRILSRSNKPTLYYKSDIPLIIQQIKNQYFPEVNSIDDGEENLITRDEFISSLKGCKDNCIRYFFEADEIAEKIKIIVERSNIQIKKMFYLDNGTRKYKELFNEVDVKKVINKIKEEFDCLEDTVFNEEDYIKQIEKGCHDKADFGSLKGNKDVGLLLKKIVEEKNIKVYKGEFYRGILYYGSQIPLVKKYIDKDLREKEDMVELKEYLELINKSFYGFDIFKKKTSLNAKRRNLNNILNKNNIKYSRSNDNHYKYYKSEIKSIVKSIIDDVEICNIDNSVYNICKENFEASELQNYYTNREAASVIGVEYLNSDTLKKNFNVIRIPSLFGSEYLVRKEQIDEVALTRKQGITVVQLQKEILDELGLDINVQTITEAVRKKYGYIEQKNNLLSNSKFISRENADAYKEEIKNNYEFDKLETLYEKVKFLIDNNAGNFVNTKIENTLKLFDEYLLYISNELKNAKSYCNYFTNIYKTLTTRLSKEIVDLSKDEIVELIGYVNRIYGVSTKKRFVYFYYWVLDKLKKDEKEILLPQRKYNEVKPYPLNEYFMTLGLLVEKIYDKKFVTNMIGNRGLSSLILYILSHYVTIWRKQDIIDKFPKPNFKIIGFNDAMAFKEWLMCEENEFTYDMGYKICTDFQEKIIERRETASKNGEKLVIYIPEFLYIAYGLVICICEVNRVMVEKTKSKVKKTDTLISKGSTKQDAMERYFPCLFGDLATVFFENNYYSNRRANKSFETYVSEKSEEWNLAIGYLLGILLRGHKLNRNLINETTKIYVDKNIDKASVRAFSLSVMNGIKYRILSIVDDEFREKEPDAKVNECNELKLSNYQTEMIMANLRETQIIVNKFLDENLLSKKQEKMVLSELLYGKKSFAKHEGTKCLLRAVYAVKENSNGDIILGKKCINSNRDGCIGCPFVIIHVYFIFELSRRVNKLINSIKQSKSKYDIQINMRRLRDLYFPILYEATNTLGAKFVSEVINMNEVTSVYNKYIGILKNKGVE